MRSGVRSGVLSRRSRRGLVVAASVLGALVALPSAPSSAKVARDYAVTATPSTVTVNAGQRAAASVRVVRTGGYANPVTLRASGMPAGVAAGFRKTGKDRFDLVFTAAANAPSGSACISVVGRATGRSRNTCITLRVQGAPPPTVTLPPAPTTTIGPLPPAPTTTRPAADFLLAASSAPQSVFPGNSISWPIAIIPLNGFNSAVNLSVVSGLPAGATASFNPPATAATSTLTIATATTTAPGTYPVTLRATGGPGTRDASIVLVVAPVADFALAGSPASVTVVQGGTGSYLISSTPRTSTTVSVTYTVAGLPDGASASFSANPAIGDTTMTVAVPATAAAGTYALVVTGQAGGFVRTLPLTLVVGGGNGYGITLVPTTASIVRGGAAAVTVNVIAQAAFTGPVTLSVSGLPAGVTGTFAANPLTLAGGQTLSTTLNLAATAGATTGTATMTVTGTAAGGLSASVGIPITVS